MQQRTIDWNFIWKEQQREHHNTNMEKNDASFWDAKDAARRFYVMAHENNGERINKTLHELPLSPESRVLDIGAGPGAIAIPLSRQVAHITAVEPSEGMCAVFSENIEHEKCDNITLINKRWEDIDVKADLKPPYDVVFASYSLDVPDIREAIQKIEEAASKYIAIYWFAGATSWEAMSRDLWPQLHGKEYVPSPKCDILYNVLYSMGIYPHIETFPFRHINRFNTLDEAVEHFAGRFFAETEQQKDLIRGYLERHTLQDDGTIIIPGNSIRVRMWWEKTEA
ncbi:class I SAM-dependent methyltransferase [Methanocalculus taiwanensis]|uniref:Class I SAM-dependent methyltransferase n=1 Tax=Methanocalculus taiwanensis TaxID=106207 RepID=A0ABD4THU8_9EURY|nr:class I SAM-dependent methyltransferase [Methanocalculus taiwanensis]MCQ1537400.1 class I SAM-dependent methyltransferase [Methanocalculus taiwanensis]